MNVSSCRTGESPALGSSSSSTDGSIISARDMATHLALAAGEAARTLAAALLEHGEQLVDELEAFRELLRAQVDAHLEVLFDGERGEDVVVLRHEADAAPATSLLALSSVMSSPFR